MNELTEEDLKVIYSDSLRKEIQDILLYAEEKGRIKINEWRNFIDYDIISILRKTAEELQKR